MAAIRAVMNLVAGTQLHVDLVHGWCRENGYGDPGVIRTRL